MGLNRTIEAPAADPNKDPSWGIMCEMEDKELKKILKDPNRILFHLKLLSPGGAREYITPVVDTKDGQQTFETLNDFFDWLPLQKGPDEITANETSIWVRNLFRAKGMGFFVVNTASRTGLAFHHDMVDLVNLEGENKWQANFYGQCDLVTKIKQDEEEFIEYLGLIGSASDED